MGQARSADLLSVDADLVAEQLLLVLGDGAAEGAHLLVVHHEAQAVLGDLLLRPVDRYHLMMDDGWLIGIF